MANVIQINRELVIKTGYQARIDNIDPADNPYPRQETFNRLSILRYAWLYGWLQADDKLR